MLDFAHALLRSAPCADRQPSRKTPIAERLQFKGPIAHPKFKKLQDEVRSYKEAYEELEATLAARDTLIADLKRAKDAKVVTKIMRKHSSTAETFEELVAAAASSLKPLSRPVCESLYYRTRGEDYYPNGRDDWDDVKAPLEYGELELNSEEKGVTPNESSGKVRKAISALDELGKWLEEPPEDFYEWYEQENDGEEAKMTLRGFWDRHLT